MVPTALNDRMSSVIAPKQLEQSCLLQDMGTEFANNEGLKPPNIFTRESNHRKKMVLPCCEGWCDKKVQECAVELQDSGGKGR